MDDSRDPSCNFFSVEAELSPGSIREWISIVHDGNKMEKGTRRSDISTKVKRHLSALGWGFAYFDRGKKKRDVRYLSPKGKWFYSLATACASCLEEDNSSSSPSRQEQILPRYDLSCSPRELVLGLRASVRIAPDVEVWKKKRKRVEDCYISGSAPVAAFNSSDEGEIRPRIGKSLKKILQVMEKKNNKCEKESVRLWRKDCGPEKNCDVCCLCHWGGELILCDGCPSAFHPTCLGLSSVPKEKLWFCPCCCCDICGSMESPRNSKLMICEQCQRRFHLKCLKQDPCLVSRRGWFCSSQCSRVFSALQNLLGCKIAVGQGDLIWTLMRAPNDDEHYDDEQLSKLDAAVKILHLGFEPTKDPFTGRDLVEELIFRKDGNGVGRGFYTVLIERKNEPVTVAAMRVDKDVAEIPLVATLSDYRRSGMCRVLMNELEKQMSQMGVRRLVLPAVAEVVTTWTQRFGFSVMESSERLELVKHGMLDFVGTVMCHKFLTEREEEDSMYHKVLMEREEDTGESSLTG